MASSSSSSTSNWRYHVFPSFHGQDVRRSFLSQIIKEFYMKGINVFNDNQIERGESIAPELKRAIRGSKIAIVMLSRNYASSSWCLNELVEIMKCKQAVGQVVVPVYYELQPSDVNKQTGEFGKVFRNTCKNKSKEVIENWRHALAEVATIRGYHSRNWADEAAMIGSIASDISTKLSSSIQLSDSDSLVGMSVHIKKMETMLSLNSDEVRMIGIWGPSGIGKSTIARTLFSEYAPHFQHCIFMDGIKGRYPKFCYDDYSMKLQLQKDFLSQILNNEDITIDHLGIAQDRLKHKRVLVVLDDVDRSMQLEALAKKIRWFGPGSNIIITTQNKELLGAHGINELYQVDFPPPDEALQMFCMYAFDQKSPYDGFETLALEVTKLADGLPLGLRVLGSYLRGRSKEEWTNVLPRLKTSLDGKIESITKFMYDSLCDDDKELSHQQLSYLPDGELNERMEEYLGKDFSELRQIPIITKQDLKEVLSTGERSFKYIVYICCEDSLQYSFASHLNMDFHRKQIDAFVMCKEALDVIERVHAFVVILSKNCFSSTSFLDNLVRVLECQRKTGQLVVPVFYGTRPSDAVVQEQGSADLIRHWSSALHELREIPGHQSLEDCRDQELVEEIVKDVYEKLSPAPKIGINSRLLEVEQLLCKQPWGIRRIGIWGMPGIRKTTLAKVVFDQISGGYEASCFIKHFDKAIHEKGFHCLLEEHFGKILKELPGVCSSITRPSLPRDKLNMKRTLVVLDDVHNHLVAEAFLGGFHWFGPGSLIIITSKDKQVFRLCQINHVYEVKSLNLKEALQLFSQSATGKDIREPELRKLTIEVIDFANGNPLALSFYGKILKGMKLSEIETAFPQRKLHTLYDIFKRSYETLDDNEKSIFLDISCFFKGENVDYVVQLLEGCGFFPHVGIDVLVEKCLVTLSENKVNMHNLIQDLGREIINRETIHIERRRRLWEPSSIKVLLEDKKLIANGDPEETDTQGTKDIEGIFMDTLNLMFDVKPGAFKNMLNLRFLKIYCPSDDLHCGLRLPKGLESLPCELRLLHWENYPLQSLPQDFDPCHLVELNMPHSQLQKLWAGTKNLKMLKMVRLCHSQQLTEIDDICKAQYIELIDLQGCINLQSFPAMCQSQHLRVLNLSGCTKIKSFPEVPPNIEELDLQGTEIRDLPVSIVTLSQQAKFNRELSNLLTKFSDVSDAFNLERLTSLVKVSSNQHLGKLVRLNMKDCSHLQSLPDMIDLESLKVLHLSGCSQLKDIQGFPRNLKELYLAGTAIKYLAELPQSLEVLNAQGCESLEGIPYGFNQLPRSYTFSDCSALSAQKIKDFLTQAVFDILRIARMCSQEQQFKEPLAFSFCAPSKKLALDLPAGSSANKRLNPSPGSTIVGFFVIFEVAFSDDYDETIGFDVRCVRRWKDKEGISRKLDKSFRCCTPGESLGKFQHDHLFVFWDLEEELDIFNDLVAFDFFPVNKQGKIVDGSCKGTKCEVYPTWVRTALISIDRLKQ